MKLAMIAIWSAFLIVDRCAPANYKKRAVIAFDVDTDLVSIIGGFYGGQDYET